MFCVQFLFRVFSSCAQLNLPAAESHQCAGANSAVQDQTPPVTGGDLSETSHFATYLGKQFRKSRRLFKRFCELFR